MFGWVSEFEEKNSPIRLLSLWPVLAPIAFVLVITLVQWLWWKYNVWNLGTIPTSKCNKHVWMAYPVFSAIFNNTITDTNVMFFQFIRGLCSIHQQMDLGIFYMWTGIRPVVFCFSAEFFEGVLKSSQNLQKSFDYTFLSLWLKEGLVTSEGPKWRQRRKAITSAFHFRILEDFVSVFDDQSRYMVHKLKEVCRTSKEINIVPHITMCTLDIICETAMGLRINAQDNKDSFYVQAMHRVAEAFTARFMRPWMWPDWIYFRTKRGHIFKQDSAKMDEFTRKVISDRKSDILNRKTKAEDNPTSENKTRRKAFMDLLLDMHFSDPEGFTERDIQEEVDSFMFAGHDTTAVATSWALYLLGMHPDVQDKVLEELDRECEEDVPFTEESLKRLKYLECVIKEVQRIYSPAPFIGRKLQEDVQVKGCRIPRGTTCIMVIYMLHRNPHFFPDPERFDPDRFLPENSADRHPFAYCPFSAGPRSCIGQKFAMLEGKTMIANILRSFRVRSVDARDKLHLSAEMVLRAKGGIRLQLTPRK